MWCPLLGVSSGGRGVGTHPCAYPPLPLNRSIPLDIPPSQGTWDQRYPPPWKDMGHCLYHVHDQSSHSIIYTRQLRKQEQKDPVVILFNELDLPLSTSHHLRTLVWSTWDPVCSPPRRAQTRWKHVHYVTFVFTQREGKNTVKWCLFCRHAINTGPLACGYLIWPPDHLVSQSTGLDWPPKFK